MRLNHSNIGTEHLLSGLTKEPEGNRCKSIRKFEYHEDKVIEEVEKLIGYGQDHVGTLHYNLELKSH
ncbi:Clp protease N-terminal domain-containing protein [Staphylococcus aureus]